MQRIRGTRTVAVGISLSLLTGCGSTLTSSEAGSATAPLGLSGESLTAPNSVGLSSVPSTSAEFTQNGDPVVTPIESRAGSSSNGTASTPSSPQSAARQSISVGILYTVNDAAASAGVDNGNSFTPRAAFESQVTAWNARGGLAGRKVNPVYAEIRSSSSAIESDLEAACTRFTQDNHVELALLATGIYFQSFAECLNKAGVIALAGDYAIGDDIALRATPGFITTSAVSTDERLSAVLRHLTSSGRFTTKDKLGVMIEGCPFNTRTYSNTVTPLAKQLGLTIADSFTGRCLEGIGDFGGLASDSLNAAVRFKARGVTQVIFISGGVEGNLVLLFTAAAEAQSFHPGYGISSAAAPVIQEANSPKSQLAKAVGVGWLPSLDTSRLTAPSAAESVCLKDFSRAGLTPAGAADRFTAYSICDVFTVADRALQATRGTSSSAALRSGIHALGSSVQAASVLEGRTDFGGTDQTAPSRGRIFQWGSCGCFVYAGSSFALAG